MDSESSILEVQKYKIIYDTKITDGTRNERETHRRQINVNKVLVLCSNN